MNTNEILLSLRKSKKISQKTLADLLGISITAYQNYEYGKSELNYEGLRKLADFYDVTTDYLLGRESSNNLTVNLNAPVDDDEFMRLYDELPDYAKQIFVNIMMMLQKNATTEKPKQRHVERLGDIEDRLKQEQEEEAKRKDVI